MPVHVFSWTAGVSAFLVAYAYLCHKLRFRRMNQKHAQYHYPTRESFAAMTADDALAIFKYTMSLEFPMIGEKSLQFALFRTYGIPGISKLLCQTAQLSELQYAPKRYADTTILIGEFMTHPPTSDRTCSAIARMNYIHSVYQKAGKISNEDMLYTLALFALEPKRWINTYEWRTLTQMEICAMGTFWKNMGDAMNISYAPLASASSDFRDGIHWIEEIQDWAEQYEREWLIPDPWNHKLATETIAILLCNVPSLLKAPATKAIAVLMGDRLRKAMIYPEPPETYKRAVSSILGFRKWFIRNLMLPRPYFMRFRTLSDHADPKTGRFFQLKYESEPWYVQDTFINRYGPSAWVTWMLGRPIPGPKKFSPQGYHIHEIGPATLNGKGMDAFSSTREKLMASGRGGCPFAFSKQ